MRRQKLLNGKFGTFHKVLHLWNVADVIPYLHQFVKAKFHELSMAFCMSSEGNLGRFRACVDKKHCCYISIVSCVKHPCRNWRRMLNTVSIKLVRTILMHHCGAFSFYQVHVIVQETFARLVGVTRDMCVNCNVFFSGISIVVCDAVQMCEQVSAFKRNDYLQQIIDMLRSKH